jgi:hypothetical protein
VFRIRIRIRSGFDQVSGSVSGFNQVGGSISGFDQVSGSVSGFNQVGGFISGFNQVSGSVSGSRRAKMTHKSRKNLEISSFEGLDVLLRADGFFCIFDVLSGGLGLSKLQFLDQKQ